MLLRRSCAGLMTDDDAGLSAGAVAAAAVIVVSLHCLTIYGCSGEAQEKICWECCTGRLGERVPQRPLCAAWDCCCHPWG